MVRLVEGGVYRVNKDFTTAGGVKFFKGDVFMVPASRSECEYCRTGTSLSVTFLRGGMTKHPSYASGGNWCGCWDRDFLEHWSEKVDG